MQVGILGTGIVGRTLGGKLLQAGHRVMMGSRSGQNPTAVRWAQEAGADAASGTFAEAARYGEIVFNCTAGTASLQALEAAGRGSLEGKVLIDVANPLDFSHGMPPTLTVCNTDSLGEQIQRAFPKTRVVKALNTMNADVMVNPAMLAGDHQLFLCGNDASAKTRAAQLLNQAFGWSLRNIIDLGDISAARGTEMVLPLWLRLMGALRTPHFNFRMALAATTSPREEEPVQMPFLTGG
jgi:predicted dinucleotide-binding enzyme